MTSYVAIRHIAYAIHSPRSKKKFMLMLTSYMDETGHSDDPNVNYVGMAGFVAPLGEWGIFAEHWQNTLDNARLKEPFHMKDFAHSQGQFKGWKEKKEKRQMLYGRLMEIIRGTKATPVGAIVSLKDFRSLTKPQQSSFLDPYYVAFQTCTRGAAIEAVFAPPEETVAMVYGFQSEFGGRAEQLWCAIKESYEFGNRMGSYASSTPKQFVQLQVADVFAYELGREFERQVKRPGCDMRWGLKQILRMVSIPIPQIILFDRKELLRRIKESNFPDQTGVGEIENNQQFSAMNQMMNWMRERGRAGEF